MCGKSKRELPLPLIARQHPLHRPRPARQLPLPRRLAHRRLEAMLQPPVVGEFCGLGIDAGLQPGEIGGAERGGFLDHRAIDRRVEQIGEALHGPVRRGHAAVDAEHDVGGLRVRPVGAHRGPEIEGLVADAFQRGMREFGGAGVAGEAEQRAADARIPVGRAEADEGRHQIDALHGIGFVGERAGLGGLLDDAEPVAQPLHGGAGDEDRAFERVGALAA